MLITKDNTVWMKYAEMKKMWFKHVTVSKQN